MKSFGLLLFGFLAIGVYAQNGYDRNAWLGFAYDHFTAGNWLMQADAGFRTCDEFIRQPRQALARGVVSRQTGAFFTGAGIAWFAHDVIGRTAMRNEWRPFLQSVYRLKKEKYLLLCRLRHELRIYPELGQLVNRTRLQVVQQFFYHKRLAVQLGLEGFYSETRNPVSEYRITIGNRLAVTEQLSALAFYTYQKQSTVNGDQHIIGLQLILTSAGNEK